MIIDGHIHLGGYFEKFDNIVASMDKAGIKKCIVVPYMFEEENLFKHYLLPTWVVSNKLVQTLTPKLLKLHRVKKNYVLRPKNYLTKLLIKKYPQRFWGFFWINPNYQDDIEELDEQISNGNFIGVKLHQVIHSFDIFSASMEKILDITDKHRLPVFIHIDSQTDFEKIKYQAQNRPNTNFIIAHLDYYYLWMEEKLTNLDNIYYDISPITTPKLIKVKKVIDNIGSQKLVFGTDSPYPGGQEYAVKRLLQLNLSTNVYDNIFFDNYSRILSQIKIPSLNLH